MSGESAASTLVEIKVKQLERGGKRLSEEERKELFESVKRTYDEQTDPRYGVEAALSEFDAIFSEKFDYQRNNRLVNNDLIGDNTNHLLQDTDTFQTQISKRAATGAEFDFRHNTFYDHSNTSVNKFRSAWDTNFEFEARQPLLQGAGVEFNRIAGPDNQAGVYTGVLLARRPEFLHMSNDLVREQRRRRSTIGKDGVAHPPGLEQAAARRALAQLLGAEHEHDVGDTRRDGEAALAERV